MNYPNKFNAKDIKKTIEDFDDKLIEMYMLNKKDYMHR